MTCYVVSHPKAGRTWLRFQLSVVLRKHFCLEVPPGSWLEVTGFPALDARVPEIVFTHDRNSHLHPVEDTADKSMYVGHDVVYLARDPRGIVVSNYYQQNRRERVLRDQPPFDGTLGEYVRHPLFGVSHIVGLMNAWAAAANVPRSFLLVRYTDMHRQPEATLRKVVNFVGLLDVPDSTVSSAVETARFDNMHDMEARDALGSGRLRPTDPSDPESYKTRRGKVNGFRDYLLPSDLAYCNAALASLNPLFGYAPEQRQET